MASGQGSKSATLPPRASPPKGTNHKSSPTFNRGIFGKLKKKFRKSKGYEFDFAESKNVEGVYFKRKKDDFPQSGLENNHEQRRSGIVEVRRSQSERSPVKPFYGVDYKHGIGNHARTSKQQTFAGNGIQQPNSSLFNKNSDVENYFLTAKNGEIDLDNDCGVSRSLDKIPSIDDMDPGYETLDEVRQKMKNLPKAKTVPYQPVTEGADACSVSHDNNAIEIRPKTQIHRRTQSSGTTDHLLSTVSDFDPNRDSGLGSPLIVDSPGSRKSAMLYRESTSSNTDICTSGGSTKKNYTHQRADLFSNLHKMRAGSCPLNTDDIVDVPISCVSNHSDTCLNQNSSKVNFEDELYANPKVIMHKKSYRGSNSGLRKLEISEHDQLPVSDHLETVAKKNDLEIDIGEISPPPLPERKYSISELDQSDTVVMETENVAQQKGIEGRDRISGSLGSCEESAHSEKVSDELKQPAENLEVDFRLSENVLRDQTSERNYLPESEKSDEINCVTNQIEVSCTEVTDSRLLVNHKDECHPVVTYWQQNQTNCENVEQNQKEKHCNTCSWTKDEEQTRLQNSSINSEDCSLDQNSLEGRYGENCGDLESSYIHKKYDPCVEVTHGSRSEERFPSIHVSFPIKPLSSSIAKCRNNSKVKTSKSSSDPDHTPSSLICEATFGSDTSSCSVISSDSQTCFEKKCEISNGCHKMKNTDRSACEVDSVKIYGKDDLNMAHSEESFNSEQDLEKNSDKVLQAVNLSNTETNLESSNQMCVSSDPPSRGCYGGLQLNLYKEKKTVPSNKECYQSQNEVIRCSEELGIKETDIAGIASSNTDDSLDLMAENKSNIPEISYEDNADLVLESLSETLAGDFSSMENLLDCSVESSNSLEEDGAPAAEPMKTSTCEKLEVCAADMFDFDSQSNANHFKRLPDYYYEDSEPIHMSLSDLGIEENHFQRRPRHDNKHPDDSDISTNTDSNGCSSNCVTPEDSEVRIGHSNDLPDVPLPSRFKTRSLALDNSNNVNHDSSTGPVLRKSKSVIDDRPPAIIPRINPELACRKDFMESMQQLKDCGWYWGPLSWDEAEIKLMNKPDGSFLVRDSSDERYILSLSFNTNGYVHHTRIEHHKGKFSFWSQPDSLGKSTIREFIEQCVRNSRNGQFLYFIRPSGPGAPPMPVHLLHPVSRFKQMQSLQHMCRFRILQVVRRDHIDKLPVPTRIKEYLRESQYYVECLED